MPWSLKLARALLAWTATYQVPARGWLTTQLAVAERRFPVQFADSGQGLLAKLARSTASPVPPVSSKATRPCPAGTSRL
ncbi:hypothetical protein DAT35_27310 [Vitiosangium sp. GDMCC 1.1324]|nr:hypothetical protein DAT35_27310 [Vitiosangium sp. GDMCC 1.1324]